MNFQKLLQERSEDENSKKKIKNQEKTDDLSIYDSPDCSRKVQNLIYSIELTKVKHSEIRKNTAAL